MNKKEILHKYSKSDLIEFKKQHIAYKPIAKIIGCSHWLLRDIYKELNLINGAWNRGVTKRDYINLKSKKERLIDKIKKHSDKILIKNFRKLGSVQLVAQKFNLNYDALSKHLQNIGIVVKRGPKFMQSKWEPIFNKYSKKELEKMYIKCKGLSGLSRFLKCSSDVTRKVMLKKHISIKQVSVIARNNGVFYNIEEYKNKCRIAHKGKKMGKDNPNWRGGKSFEVYGSEFNKDLKKQIKERDGYVCQGKDCGISEVEHLMKFDKVLCVHHIDYNKKNNSDVNLMTLCNECNLKVNYNRKYWEDYFTDIMISRIPEEIKKRTQ